MYDESRFDSYDAQCAREDFIAKMCPQPMTHEERMRLINTPFAVMRIPPTCGHAHGHGPKVNSGDVWEN